MSETDQIRLKLQLQGLSELWVEFCQKHTELYELTCDEYINLLASDMNTLDETISKKTQLLGYIDALENRRSKSVEEASHMMGIPTPEKIQDFITVLSKSGEENLALDLKRTNMILLDIIDKIQEQNKSNQIFLNKAINSLQDLRASFNGRKNFKTYSSAGVAKSNSSI